MAARLCVPSQRLSPTATVPRVQRIPILNGSDEKHPHPRPTLSADADGGRTSAAPATAATAGIARCSRALAAIYPGLSADLVSDRCAVDPRLRLRELKVCRECAIEIANASGKLPGFAARGPWTDGDPLLMFDSKRLGLDRQHLVAAVNEQKPLFNGRHAP